ncbi:hypothetical protein [Caminibacter pacificus]
MIKLEKVKNFFDIKKEQIKLFIKENKKSYVFYILATILFGILFILAFISPKSLKLLLIREKFQLSFFSLIVYSIALLIILLFLIGFVLDLYYFWKLLKKKKFITYIISILSAIFAYPISQSLAKSLIYDITNENPDFYQTAIQFYSLFYEIIVWIIILSMLFIISYFILAFINIILIFVDMLPFKIVHNFLDKVFMRLNIRKFHLFFTLIGLAFFIWFFLPISKVLINKINKYIFSFANSSIIYISYYPNKVCNNIPKGVYIKLLGTNDVSVTNITSFDMLFNNLNKKIIFQYSKCER